MTRAKYPQAVISNSYAINPTYEQQYNFVFCQLYEWEQEGEKVLFDLQSFMLFETTIDLKKKTNKH